METGDGIAYENVTVEELLPSEGTQVEFLYDYGDHWSHTLARLADPTDLAPSIPALVAGEGVCPPDDIGGIGRYNEVAAAWRNGGAAGLKGAADEDLIDWLPHDFDPDGFDLSAQQQWFNLISSTDHPQYTAYFGRPIGAVLADLIDQLSAHSPTFLVIEAAALRLGFRTPSAGPGRSFSATPPASKALPIDDEAADIALIDRIFRPYLTFLSLVDDSPLALTKTGSLNVASMRTVIEALGLPRFFGESTRPTEANTLMVARLHDSLRRAKLVRPYRSELRATPKARELLNTWPIVDGQLTGGATKNDALRQAGRLLTSLILAESISEFTKFCIGLGCTVLLAGKDSAPPHPRLRAYFSFDDLPDYQPFGDLIDYRMAVQSYTTEEGWSVTAASGVRTPASIREDSNYDLLLQLCQPPEYVDHYRADLQPEALSNPTVALLAREVLWPSQKA
ncbi:plasmid pRiA4b ORF-3 family protein [Corynebacterium cystitidis]|uniref:plasmid pRiA4b ORF-3 family protein n=2 Tax=Corynebacterium cystitidis TaxID=35757 RepID=UPI00211ED302|nr:plasmid pRiA4b ORF-3 family protein [Corynebacterium cystitidis]